MTCYSRGSVPPGTSQMLPSRASAYSQSRNHPAIYRILPESHYPVLSQSTVARKTRRADYRKGYSSPLGNGYGVRISIQNRNDRTYWMSYRSIWLHRIRMTRSRSVRVSDCSSVVRQSEAVVARLV